MLSSRLTRKKARRSFEAGLEETSATAPASESTHEPQRSSEPELLRAITKLPARAGGSPFWLQEPAGDDDFLLQLDARFAPLNLGDASCLYVFRDHVAWQSL